MICGLNSCLIELSQRIFNFKFSFVLTFSADLSISLGNINVTHCIKPFLLSIYQVLRESFTATRRIKNKIISFWSQTGRRAEPNCPYVKAVKVENFSSNSSDIHFPTSLHTGKVAPINAIQNKSIQWVFQEMTAQDEIGHELEYNFQ